MPGASAAALLANLGEGSALARRESPWRLDTHVAVRTLEEVHHLGRLMMALKGVKKRQIPAALVIPRPGEKASTTEQRGWIGDLVGAVGAGVEVKTVG